MISIRNRASLPNSLAGRLACAALALCLPASVWAETLADAVAAAYDRNPQLVQQRYLQKARDETVVQARSQYGPSVTAQVQGTHAYEWQGPVSLTKDVQQTTVQVQQPLYTSGRLRGQLAAAQAGMLGGREQLRLIEEQVVQDVVQVYAGVLRDEARVEIGRENVEILRGQLRQNAKRQQYGDVTLTDVAQSDARLAAAELQLAALQADLAVSRGQYLQIVGHNPGQLEPLPQLGVLPPTIDAAFDLAEENNPNLRIAQYTESQSSATAAATRGSGGPTISAFGQGIATNNSLFRIGGGSSTFKEAVAGFTISQPLFSSGLIRSQVREADMRNRADQAGIDAARRSVMQSITTAWVQLSAARVAVTTGQRQVESAQQAFAGMSCEELNGLRSPIETLNAEEELQSAELQLVQNRFQVYLSHASLLAATGNLSAQQIAEGINVYDPEANFRRVRYSGTTPFEFVARGIDRIGSANPRGPFSNDLAGGNVPHPENPGHLAPAPSRALMNKPLARITEGQLRLPNGDTAHCPLNDIRRR